jgi:hypothetical protein
MFSNTLNALFHSSQFAHHCLNKGKNLSYKLRAIF